MSVKLFFGTLFKFDEKDKHVVIMCGMSAAFAAIFGTPMAAVIFAMEVNSVGIMYYSAFVLSLLMTFLYHFHHQVKELVY